MKQADFQAIVVTLIGVCGSLAISPFYGLAVYYLFAILRPQYMWAWSLPQGVPLVVVRGGGGHRGDSAGRLGRPGRLRNGVETRSPERPAVEQAAHVLMLLFGAWICVSYVVGVPSELGNLYMVDYAKHFTMRSSSPHL